MKVLLKVDIDNIGYAGEVHDVAPGYGRNYLIPQSMAVKATPSVMKQAEGWRRKAEARREEIRAENSALAERISAQSLTFTARAGDTGKLYGSVTTTQVADELNEQLGTEIDRRKIGSDPLRQIGSHNVVVRLSAEHQPEFSVIIEREEEIGSAAVVDEDVSEDIADEAEIVEADDEDEISEELYSEADQAVEIE